MKSMFLTASLSLLILLSACKPQGEQSGDAGQNQEVQAAQAAKAAGPITVAVADAKALPAKQADLVLLDVRTPEEFAAGHLEGAKNIDYKDTGFGAKMAALDKSKPYLVYCHSGRRSAAASEQMAAAGFSKVYNLDGGIEAWQAAGQPVKK